jgi:hypothetical protein
MSLSRRFALCVLFVVSPVLAHADVVLDWNARMFTTITGQSPFGTARLAAITQLAVFEAVNAITKIYEPYLGTIDAPDGASAEAAAATAAHTVLRYYFPAQSGPLDTALSATLASIPDGQAKSDGISTGLAAAGAMIALRANDGSAPSLPPTFYVPPSSDPGQWQLTPSCTAGGGTNFHWRDVTPFGVPAVSAFRLGPPPGLAQGKYAKDFAEVLRVGGLTSAERSQDREDIARFYAGFSPVSWANSAARQVAAAQAKSLPDNARALALLNMALSDAAVAVFDTKYHYNLWRPETAIKSADSDGNHRTDVDLGFVPLISAPCFPSYPSAHGTLTASAREVLERLYGPSGHDITFTTTVLPGVTLHYTAFKPIVEDISDARVFGGIHFRFDQDGGERQGTEVGKYVFKYNLRPVHP